MLGNPSIAVSKTGSAGKKWDTLYDIPQTNPGGVFGDRNGNLFYRGRIGIVCDDLSQINYSINRESKFSLSDKETLYGFYNSQINQNANIPDLHKEIEFVWNNEPIKLNYNCSNSSYTNTMFYVTIIGDLSRYSYISLSIKGISDCESINFGIQEIMANKTALIGNIKKFLNPVISDKMSTVKIPVSCLHDSDITKVLALVFVFPKGEKGFVLIDDLRFYYKELYAYSIESVYKKGYLMLDDFNYNKHMNLLNRKTSCYSKLPSFCKYTLDEKIFYAEKGYSLKLEYEKKDKGWCGYCSNMNETNNGYYNLCDFIKVSFKVKGAKGGEDFEIGLADRNGQLSSNFSNSGSINKYLKHGVKTTWQEAVIPISDFENIDLTEMGSFIISFTGKQKGTIWIDELKFHLPDKDYEDGENLDSIF